MGATAGAGGQRLPPVRDVVGAVSSCTSAGG
jgi:hypothetical protein